MNATETRRELRRKELRERAAFVALAALSPEITLGQDVIARSAKRSVELGDLFAQELLALEDKRAAELSLGAPPPVPLPQGVLESWAARLEAEGAEGARKVARAIRTRLEGEEERPKPPPTLVPGPGRSRTP